jgi:SAM-dependent MidA family methyltransferase
MQVRGFLLEHQVEECIDLCHKWVLLDSTGQCKHISPAARIIANEIARSGIMSYARFMELALYHPDHGYYRKSHIGKGGDFFTSVSVGPLFGQMVAYFLAKQLARLDGEIQIVEAGANDGAWAADILAWLHGNRPEIARRLQYLVVEPLAELQQRQRAKLSGFNVRWVRSVEELPQVHGAIISNELLDAFPVHIFRWRSQEQRWREYGVNLHFQFAPMDNIPEWACEALADLKPLEAYLPDAFTVEFSSTAERWWAVAATKLSKGLMLALDYGDEATALWSPARSHGTVRAFRNHKLVNDPLADPGEQDLTASVNFTRLRAAGERAGLHSERLQTQAQFLVKIAADFFSNPTAAEVRQFQTLTHPEHLGRSFKALVQSRTSSQSSILALPL